MSRLRFLSLFAGIGGFDLGLERAGMECVGQVEIDPFCRAVLEKHWPDVPRLEDVRSVRGDEFGRVDLVCGGVPCQPASCAGKRKGADDDRWLWPEFIRIVRACGPTWFVAENVRGFLSLPAAGGVVRELEGAGYEVRTVLLGAHHVGAPHRRDRIWIIGRLDDARCQRRQQVARGAHGDEAADEGWTAQHHHESSSSSEGDRAMADAASGGLGADGCAPGDAGHADECGAGGVADPQGPRREGDEPAGDPRAGRRPGEHGGVRWPARPGEPQHGWEDPRLVVTSGRGRKDGGVQAGPGDQGTRATSVVGASEGGRVGLFEPSVGVATDGLPRRMADAIRRDTGWSDAEAEKWWRRNRVRLPGVARRFGLKALGNAVVPDVAQVIGEAIVAAHGATP